MTFWKERNSNLTKESKNPPNRHDSGGRESHDVPGGEWGELGPQSQWHIVLLEAHSVVRKGIRFKSDIACKTADVFAVLCTSNASWVIASSKGFSLP